MLSDFELYQNISTNNEALYMRNTYNLDEVIKGKTSEMGPVRFRTETGSIRTFRKVGRFGSVRFEVFENSVGSVRFEIFSVRFGSIKTRTDPISAKHIDGKRKVKGRDKNTTSISHSWRKNKIYN